MTMTVITVLLEYLILFLLCGFVYKTMRIIYQEIRTKANEKKVSPAEAKVSLLVLESYDEAAVEKKISFSETLTIGRGGDNDIVLADAYVSHHHVVISPLRNQYQIEDLHSRNHTYINDELLTGRTFLQNGDLIKIGRTIFRFER